MTFQGQELWISATIKSGSMNEVMMSAFSFQLCLKPSDKLDLYIAIVQWLVVHA